MRQGVGDLALVGAKYNVGTLHDSLKLLGEICSLK